MQLNLHENIKNYRKEMGLTQEALAEAFGVTVGAVSKWESGSTVPDIVTLMELADFFNISMDVLVGYDMSSKRVTDIVKRINKLLNEGKHEEAMAAAEKAIVRYPGNFKILKESAQLYSVIYTLDGSETHRKRSIELYETSLRYISQNDDPDFNEIFIRFMIAELKSEKAPEEAIEDFKKINYLGIADINIARNLMKTGKLDESLHVFTRVLVSVIVRMIGLSMSMTGALIATDRPKAFREAYDLIQWGLEFFDSISKEEKSYLSKVKVTLLILKAMCLSCLKEYEDMRYCVDEAYALAREYDKNPSNSLSGKIKFWHANEDFKPALYDDLGQSAVDSIEKLLALDDNEPFSESVVKKITEVKKYWESIREKDEVKEGS